MNSKNLKRNSGITKKTTNKNVGAHDCAQKGITLIALVITIIVMLILVAVTITMAINGGLFEKAQEAGQETNEAVEAEQQLANGQVTIGDKTYGSIDEYIDGMGDIEGKDGEIFSAIYTENTPITQGEYTAVIPKGFSVGKSEGINTIEDGLVIQDEEGNQFVWIPVEVAETDTETSIASFYRSAWDNNARTSTLTSTSFPKSSSTWSNFTEPYASGYTNETAEYNAMLKSVYDNKGFYIGRFEAGAQKQDANGNIIARTNVENGTTKMVVQRDQYPYIYVGWGLTMSDYTSDVTYSSKNQGKGALLLSKELYGTEADAGKYGVTSTLCYGIMWDAMLDFIKDEEHNVTSSADWGNCKDNLWTIDRKTARYTESPSGTATWSLIDDETNDKKEKISSSGILLTTGASDDFASKNIFDIAGNVYERTNEAYSSSNRVNRGGDYSNGGSNSPASFRVNFNLYFCVSNVGFRPALYITNE